MNFEHANTDPQTVAADRGTLERRTLLRGATWSVPVLAATIAVPLAAASNAPLIAVSQVFSFEPGTFTVYFEATVNGAPIASNGFSAMLSAAGLDLQFDSEMHHDVQPDGTVLGYVEDGIGVLFFRTSEPAGTAFNLVVTVRQSVQPLNILIPEVEE